MYDHENDDPTLKSLRNFQLPPISKCESTFLSPLTFHIYYIPFEYFPNLKLPSSSLSFNQTYPSFSLFGHPSLSSLPTLESYYYFTCIFPLNLKFNPSLYPQNSQISNLIHQYYSETKMHRPNNNNGCNCFLVIFFLVLVSAANADTIRERFKEAPQFYNSPTCPKIVTTTPSISSFSSSPDVQDVNPQGSLVCAEEAVHVAMTLDLTYLRGSMAAILSVLQHTSCPQNIFFHFVISSSTPTSNLRATIATSFPYLHFELYPFEDSSVSGLISTSIRSALDCPLNYARSYLANLLPLCVSRVLYLDSDVVVVDDIETLYNVKLVDDKVLAAPQYCNANFTTYFTSTFWSNPSLSVTFANREPCYFNTGVMVIDLNRWRAGDYTRRIEEWMELQKRIRIYELGSLPPFLLVFAGNIVPVDHRWNQHGLGGDNFRGLCRDLHPGPVSLLHWSGKGKPWARLDANRPCPLDALWAPYDLLRTPYALES